MQIEAVVEVLSLSLSLSNLFLRNGRDGSERVSEPLQSLQMRLPWEKETFCAFVARAFDNYVCVRVYFV